MKKTVLITGATSGIGFAMANKFAKEGYHLVLVSSNNENLGRTKKVLSEKFSECCVVTICQDLCVLQAAQRIYERIKEQKLQIDILVNNAGFGLIGELQHTDIEKEENMLHINIRALTQLTRLFLSDMYERKEGKILNVASVGAFQPGPYTAVYYATKAYVASFSRAVRYEAASHNVQVCTLYPGTTRTSFFQKTGTNTPGYAMSAEKVAKCAYRGLKKNKEMIVPGVLNKLLRLVPVKIKLKGVAMLKK